MPFGHCSTAALVRTKEYEEFNNMKTTKDKSRLYGAKIYFVLSIIIFGAIFLIWKWNYFTDAPLPGFRNWRRILWCISWSFLGFSAIAHKSSKKNHTGSAWPSYATVYPLALDSYVSTLRIYLSHY